ATSTHHCRVTWMPGIGCSIVCAWIGPASVTLSSCRACWAEHAPAPSGRQPRWGVPSPTHQTAQTPGRPCPRDTIEGHERESLRPDRGHLGGVADLLAPLRPRPGADRARRIAPLAA